MSGRQTAVAAASETGDVVPAGLLPPWHTAPLTDPPKPGWRLWIGLLGPGVVLAGTSIGSGEWLFGPAVSAQYGGTLLWLASISIILQVFCNLMMMRYTLYCGEPIIVGGLRTWPGPATWIVGYMILDIAAIWPYNASNAAVPLAAAALGRLPTYADQGLVRFLGFTIFTLSFVPLIFGGTVYRMLEKIMTFKLVVVLGYLTFIALFMVSGRAASEVIVGFFRFGTIPLRADTVIVGRHFTVSKTDGATRYVVAGTIEKTGLPIGDFLVYQGAKKQKYKLNEKLASDLTAERTALLSRANEHSEPDTFFLETTDDDGVVISASGSIADQHLWQPRHLALTTAQGEKTYARLDDVPQPYAGRLGELLDNEGLERRNLFGYIQERGHLPPLDWATIVAFIAIAGAGGLSNTLFSNYTRDKGWGMGRHVGAIPSAFGGMHISLSHVGKVFPVNRENLTRWRGWLRHIFRDQVAVWMVASFLGMALPCMMSLEFIRNATVTGDRVAAMSAEGIATRYPQYGQLFWILTLLCGFLVLAPGQVSVGDQIARRWTDIIWTASSRAKRLSGDKVKFVYYSILATYAAWGLLILWLIPEPLRIAKIGAVLGNVAIGFSSLHAWYANRALLPRELQPNWLLQLGVLCCGLFFLGISVVVVMTMTW